jgi:hypothetical protein
VEGVDLLALGEVGGGDRGGRGIGQDRRDELLHRKLIARAADDELADGRRRGQRRLAVGRHAADGRMHGLVGGRIGARRVGGRRARRDRVVDGQRQVELVDDGDGDAGHGGSQVMARRAARRGGRRLGRSLRRRQPCPGHRHPCRPSALRPSSAAPVLVSAAARPVRSCLSPPRPARPARRSAPPGYRHRPGFQR